MSLLGIVHTMRIFIGWFQIVPPVLLWSHSLSVIWGSFSQFPVHILRKANPRCIAFKECGNAALSWPALKDKPYANCDCMSNSQCFTINMAETECRQLLPKHCQPNSLLSSQLWGKHFPATNRFLFIDFNNSIWPSDLMELIHSVFILISPVDSSKILVVLKLK